MSRPRRAEGVTTRIYIRTTDQEKAELKSSAERANLTISEYIRRAGLGRRIRSRVDEKAMGELGRLGRLVKLCLKDLRKIPEAQEIRMKLNGILEAIPKKIQALDKGEE